MVSIPPPPPSRYVDPLFHEFPVGTNFVRLFNPTDHGATAVSFRTHGPHKRFDHHRYRHGDPSHDPERGIYYAALTFAGCLVEVFGDNGSGMVEPGEWHVARPNASRDLHLLDLRGKGIGSGAWRAGSVAALATNARYGPSQAWSRYIYDHPEIYSVVDGIVYENAHNNDDAVVLYERARDALSCLPENVLRLDDLALRPHLLAWILDAGLIPGFV